MIVRTKLDRAAWRVRRIIRAHHNGLVDYVAGGRSSNMVIRIDQHRSAKLFELVMPRPGRDLAYTMIGADWEIEGDVGYGEERVNRFSEKRHGSFYEDAALLMLRYTGQ